MSLCKNPRSWTSLRHLSICLPSIRVVNNENRFFLCLWRKVDRLSPNRSKTMKFTPSCFPLSSRRGVYLHPEVSVDSSEHSYLAAHSKQALPLSSCLVSQTARPSQQLNFRHQLAHIHTRRLIQVRIELVVSAYHNLLCRVSLWQYTVCLGSLLSEISLRS